MNAIIDVAILDRIYDQHFWGPSQLLFYIPETTDNRRHMSN